MIKIIVTVLFKSSAVIKLIFINLLHELRFLFKGLSEILISGFDSLNYHVFQPIRLLRFQDVRDFVFSTEGIIIIIISFLIIIFLISKTNIKKGQ